MLDKNQVNNEIVNTQARLDQLDQVIKDRDFLHKKLGALHFMRDEINRKEREEQERQKEKSLDVTEEETPEQEPEPVNAWANPED